MTCLRNRVLLYQYTVLHVVHRDDISDTIMIVLIVLQIGDKLDLVPLACWIVSPYCCNLCKSLYGFPHVIRNRLTMTMIILLGHCMGLKASQVEFLIL